MGMNHRINLVFVFLLILPIFFIPLDSSALLPNWIPPVRSFVNIFSGSNHIQPHFVNGNLTLVGNNMNITLSNGTKTPSITFSAFGSTFIGKVSLINQTSSQGPITIYTTPNNGQYLVSAYQVVSQASTAGTLSTSIQWNDETGTSQSQTPASNLSLVTLGSFTNGESFIDAKSGTPIKYQSTLSGITGTPKYDLFITVTKLS